MQMLGGGCARRNALEGGACGEADALRFRITACGNQRMDTEAHRRCINGLMTQMADGAGVGRRTGMSVPDHSARHPDDQPEKRYR
jgi:hypothetical protein